MILTVTLNPSMDRRYVVDDFAVGSIFRAREVQYTPGGKGVNVSKVVKSLGGDVIATGFLGGKSGEFIAEKLDEYNIENRFIHIANETRSCLAILSDNNSQTEVLEPGPSISKDELIEFYRNYEKLLDSCDIICASGSLPSGVPENLYKDLIEIATTKGKKFILDTSGDALKEGIKASPFLIKPNKEELENIFGASINTKKELVDGIKSLDKYDIEIIIVSLGSRGSIICKEGKIYKVNIPKVAAINPVGSGDSMIAGIAVALKRGYDFNTMVKLASACGTANALESETGKINVKNVDKLMGKIGCEEMILG